MLTAALSGLGIGLSAYGKLRSGRSAKKAAKFEAEQYERKAARTQAVAQRRAQEIGRQGQLAQSRALAVAAASGGGASDANVMDVISNLSADTNYQQMVSLYEGDVLADELRLQGEVRRTEGESAWQAGRMGALGTALSGGSSLYANYGKDIDQAWQRGKEMAGEGWHWLQSRSFPGGPRRA